MALGVARSSAELFSPASIIEIQSTIEGSAGSERTSPLILSIGLLMIVDIVFDAHAQDAAREAIVNELIAGSRDSQDEHAAKSMVAIAVHDADKARDGVEFCEQRTQFCARLVGILR